LAIIRSYEAQSPFPFIYLPQETNMGHVLNYKRAFAACTGDYVSILEGDDWWCNPYHLQKHLDFLDEHRECVLSSASPYLYSMDTGRFEFAWHPEDKGETWLITAAEEATGNKITNLSTCVIRNNALQVVCANESLWHVDMLDWYMELLLAEYGFLAKHKHSTSVYRVQKEGLWSGLNKEEQKDLMMRQVNEYDELLDKRYTKEFDVIRHNYNPLPLSLKKRLLLWCPPFFHALLKIVLPPIFLKRK
jgi:glycosyltransferase involved in cell wall biosynthesis